MAGRNNMTNDCDCGHDHNTISKEDFEDLKQSIKAAGFEVEETPEGDIKVLQPEK